MTEEQKQRKKEYNARYREEHRERLRLYARNFRKLGLATRNPAKQIEAIKSWEKRFPERRKAHKAVFIAVRNGQLKKLPCSVCGIRRTQAHHDDYSKPLEVVWLCHIHHYERDRSQQKRGG